MGMMKQLLIEAEEAAEALCREHDVDTALSVADDIASRCRKICRNREQQDNLLHWAIYSSWEDGRVTDARYVGTIDDAIEAAQEYTDATITIRAMHPWNYRMHGHADGKEVFDVRIAILGRGNAAEAARQSRPPIRLARQG